MSTRDTYTTIRRRLPFLPAHHALAMAKRGHYYDRWEATSRDGQYGREVDGFDVTLTIEGESIYPRDDDTFGRYVDDIRYWQEHSGYYNWGGQYPPPHEELPLGLPYTSFRYHGPGWVQGEGTGYFIPEGVKEQYDYYRRMGQSKSVAWDMTKAWVESTLADFFSAPLTNCIVTVTASRNGIELGEASIGTSYIDGPDDFDDLFATVEDYDLVGEAIAEAQEALAGLIESERG